MTIIVEGRVATECDRVRHELGALGSTAATRTTAVADGVIRKIGRAGYVQGAATAKRVAVRPVAGSCRRGGVTFLKNSNARRCARSRRSEVHTGVARDIDNSRTAGGITVWASALENERHSATRLQDCAVHNEIGATGEDVYTWI